MHRLTYEITFLTPAFLGGFGNKSCEWRAASVRGQLRWWFRAVAGGVWGGDLERVRRAEARLLGSTEAASVVQVVCLAGEKPIEILEDLGRLPRLTAESLAERWGLGSRDPAFPSTVKRLTVIDRNRGGEASTSPIQYLGYGCVDHKGLVRPCIAPGATARLRLQWRSDRWQRVPEEDRALLGRAVAAWLSLGGIGGKSRNGFGSVAGRIVDGEIPTEWEPGAATVPLNQLPELAGRLMGDADGMSQAEAQWTHFSSRARIYRGCDPRRDWQQALTDVGAWLIAFRRRYGSPNDTRTLRGRPLAHRDYVWAAPKAPAATRRKALPDRAGFGLPLPFGEKANGETATWRCGAAGNGDQRRASPLLIRLHPAGQGLVPVLTHLPARFLPPGGELHYKDHPRTAASLTPEQAGIVEDFLGDLEGKRLIGRVAP